MLGLKLNHVSKRGHSGLGNALVPNRRQAITWNNADSFHLRIDAPTGLSELRPEVSQDFL